MADVANVYSFHFTSSLDDRVKNVNPKSRMSPRTNVNTGVLCNQMFVPPDYGYWACSGVNSFALVVPEITV